MMTIGVFKTSLKRDERRVPIYPEHVPFIRKEIRKSLVFESGYGGDYGLPDEYFTAQGIRMATRERLFEECELLILAKPMPRDLSCMKPGQVLFGWSHCVQQEQITQHAIDRRTTIVAWEAMHHWTARGDKGVHIFYKNNEIAGYAAVLHCLQIMGADGHYGPRRKVVVLSYGSVSRGAVYALQGRGFNNIQIFTRRPPHLVADQNPDVYYDQYCHAPDGSLVAKGLERGERPLISELGEADIICNGILQDTDRPVMFVRDEEIVRLKRGSLIIDVSCDQGMGFAFARPTSFADPAFQVGDRVTYYSVDHCPSYLWNAASREISKAILPYLEIVARGADAWKTDETIERAVEIRDGVILNPKITSFQNREKAYPHERRRDE